MPTLVAVLALAVGVACNGDDGDDGMGPTGPFDLTFQLDATYQGPHGGQTILLAVVRASNGEVVARDEGTVSALADPAYAFTATNLLQSNTAYEIHYWIDSNFGDTGTPGVCEGIDVDHQWSVAVAAPTGDVTITEDHVPATRADVCSSFEFDLTFRGDASFRGAHGGHAIYAAVGTSPDFTVLARASGTVSGTADPAFSFSFPGVLVPGVDREIRYWIDSNFTDGTVGVCDPTANDHQWAVTVSGTTDDVTHTEEHTPAAVTSVCESFTADLTFSGDASFQNAHGGQDIFVSLVRASDGAIVATDAGVVSDAADPSFSFSFPGILVLGVAYELQYWIDSNFGGAGTVGECDAKDIDHQWIIDVPAVQENVDIPDFHRPTETDEVCGSATPVSFADDIQPIFTGSCAFSGCHGDTNTQPSAGPMELSAGVAYDNIVNVASTELPSMDRIEPLQPDNSYLVHKIQGTQVGVGGTGEQMPLTGGPLTQEVIDLIRRWVTEGANNN